MTKQDLKKLIKEVISEKFDTSATHNIVDILYNTLRKDSRFSNVSKTYVTDVSDDPTFDSVMGYIKSGNVNGHVAINIKSPTEIKVDLSLDNGTNLASKTLSSVESTIKFLKDPSTSFKSDKNSPLIGGIVTGHVSTGYKGSYLQIKTKDGKTHKIEIPG